MTMSTLRRATIFVAASALLVTLWGCGDAFPPVAAGNAEKAPGAPADFERGPHNGRLLRDGAFSLEVTVFEDGVPPELHVYPYVNNQTLDPRQVQLNVSVSRLGGEVNQFSFQPQEDYLRANGVLKEPHSFDVSVAATEGGRTHSWTYESYEGRTTINPEAAEAGGVKTEKAGPATITETIDLAGRVEIRPQARVEVRAWYPGPVMEMTKSLGQRVQKGEVVARVQSSSSLQTYPIPAPMTGIIAERNANVGDLSDNRALYVITDVSQLDAELNVHPEDADAVRLGQRVEIRDITGSKTTVSDIETLLPNANPTTQTIIARVELPGDGKWRSGMSVEGRVATGSYKVPLAVRTPALQRFRDFTVVYAKVGNTYEVRMLQLGRQTEEWTEILGGLEPGTEYVSENAYLIRADVEKSGASHDH